MNKINGDAVVCMNYADATAVDRETRCVKYTTSMIQVENRTVLATLARSQYTKYVHK